MVWDKFDYKMVIALRVDLKLSKGKLAAQAAHAAVMAVEDAKRKRRNWLKSWFSEGQKKVVVRLEDDTALTQLHQKALQANLPCAVITKTGSAKQAASTETAIAIGPGPNNKMDEVTASLKLL